MQQVCNNFAMDITDPRMGPEQRCKHCKFMKKEHNQNNSQQLSQSDKSSNKVSDMMKKFSTPNNQVQEKFKEAVITYKKQEQNSQQTTQNNQTQQNLSQQANIPIRKIESQTYSENSQSQPSLEQNVTNLEKQQSKQSNLTTSNEGQQQQNQQIPIQNKLASNPFLKKDQEQKSDQVQARPSIPQKQPTNQIKKEQQPQINVKDVCQDQSKKSSDKEIKNTIQNQSPIIQQNLSTESQQSPNKQQQNKDPIAVRAQNLPIFGFGPPPVRKSQTQQEPESELEQKMIDRPVIQQKKNKRTLQEFSDLI